MNRLGNWPEVGTAIPLNASDMAETIALADRILIVNEFRPVGEIARCRNYDAVGR